MGIFDNLFGSFTGAPQQEAAELQRQYFDRLYSDISGRGGTAQDLGLSFLRGGLGQGQSSMTGYYDQSRHDIADQIPQAVTGLTTYSQHGTNALQTGYQQGMEALERGLVTAAQGWDPLRVSAARYGAEAQDSSQMSADALGLNGPEGIARARSAFQTGPGYDFMRDQGLEAILRNANAAGMVASGNQMQESQRYGTGLANQEWNNWVNRLGAREQFYNPLEAQALTSYGSGRGGAYLAATGREAELAGGTARSLADLYSSTGRGLADMYTGYGRNLADIATRFGLQSGNMFAQEGMNEADLVRSIFGTQTGMASSFASPYANTYMNSANAQTQGGQNLWGLIGSAVSGLASFI